MAALSTHLHFHSWLPIRQFSSWSWSGAVQALGLVVFHLHIQFYLLLFNDDEVLLARQDINSSMNIIFRTCCCVGYCRTLPIDRLSIRAAPLLPEATQACSCSILPEINQDIIVMDVLGLYTSMTSYRGTALPWPCIT